MYCVWYIRYIHAHAGLVNKMDVFTFWPCYLPLLFALDQLKWPRRLECPSALPRVITGILGHFYRPWTYNQSLYENTYSNAVCFYKSLHWTLADTLKGKIPRSTSPERAPF